MKPAIQSNTVTTQQLAPSDDDLIARVRAGDRDATGLLYRKHAEPLLKVARAALGKDAGEADDVVQDVFVTLLEEATRFSPAPGKVSVWLNGIARRISMKRVRDLGRERGEAPDS